MSTPARPVRAVLTLGGRLHRGGRRAVGGSGAPALGHARVAALAAALATGSVLAFCAGPALASLPDGRGYELVTPANKDQGDPYLRAGIFADFQSSVDGNGFSYPSLYGFPGAQSYGLSYMSARTAAGWSSENVVPPQSPTTGGLCPAFTGMVGYSSDMSKAALVDGGGQAGGCGTDDPQLVPGEPQGAQNIFVVNRANNSYQLVNVTPAGVTPADAVYEGGSSDLSHVVFTENAQLTGNAPAASTNLYEWSGGTVSLVTVLPDHTAAVGTIAGGSLGNALHAVSADGSRIYFAANNNLYLRQSATSTVQVDAAASGAPGPGGGGVFVGASTDGSKVFFTDDAANGLTTSTVAGSGPNLYEYDVASATLTDLTPTSGAEVQGGVEVSDDGSYAYFVANGNLAAGASDGQPNLYVDHNGTPTFIATLNSGSDSCDWSAGCLTARVSPSGQFLVFNSVNSLTGFDNTDATSGSPDTEIFRYDAAAPSPGLVCVSCGTAAPTGSTGINAPELSGIPSAIDVLQHYVSDTGQVFFDTPNALVPTDSNGVRDVYEYESGQQQLLSSGTDSTDSLYLDNTADGSNAFFVTVQRLIPQDIDGAYDIYDARVGGGFPFSPPPPPCQAEACKPTISNPPPPNTDASITFFGPANPTPPSTGEVRVQKRAVTGTSIKLHVKVPGPGALAITGHGLNGKARSVHHRGAFTVTVHLTDSAKKALKHKQKMKLTITVRYVPASGPASTAKVQLTVKA